jgi:endonuclease III related protein
MKKAQHSAWDLERARTLELYFHALHNHFGPQRWWPAKTRMEVILGAILTQNTSWHNVQLALGELRRAGLLRHSALSRIPASSLARIIRPAGFFRQKARTILGFLQWLENNFRGSLNQFFAAPPEVARNGLLTVTGLGPETTDAILLYAGRHPFFVADAYTRRVLSRHGLIPNGAGYAATQEFLHRHLKRNYLIYNEYHALIVEVGKRYCVKLAPKCCNCPLEPFLPASKSS